MVAAVNSKSKQYDPFRYMVDGRALKEKQRAKAESERRAMTGEEIIGRFRQLGFPVIDKRQHGIG